MATGKCEKCGANLAMVGLAHRCVDRRALKPPPTEKRGMVGSAPKNVKKRPRASSAAIERGVKVLGSEERIASALPEKVTGPLDRITFSAPTSEGWPKRLEAERERRGKKSTSEAIRALLEEALKP